MCGLHYKMDTNSQTVELITLNVGGKLFTTVESTLRSAPNSFFTALLDTHSIEKNTDAKGNIFIDRDGSYFSFIMEYLRDGTISTLTNLQIADKLIQEANFYALPELAALIEQKKSGYLRKMSVMFCTDKDKVISSDWQVQDKAFKLIMYVGNIRTANLIVTANNKKIYETSLFYTGIWNNDLYRKINSPTAPSFMSTFDDSTQMMNTLEKVEKWFFQDMKFHLLLLDSTE